MNDPLLANLDWLTINANRNYPLEDSASRLADSGALLPEGLIADLRVHFKRTSGVTAFISGVRISNTLITLTIAAWPVRREQNTGAAGTFTPLATVTVVKPVDVKRNYRLEPAGAAGACGWIAFGTDVNSLNTGIYTFTEPKNSAILPRLAVAYQDPPVTDIGLLNSITRLTGAINVNTDTEDKLVIEQSLETIEGQEQSALVFRLNSAVQSSILSQLPGPCGATPTGTCRSTPVRSINGLVPDCSGVFNIYIRETYSIESSPDLTAVNGYFLASDPLKTAVLNLGYRRGISSVCNTVSEVPATETYSQCDRVVGDSDFTSGSPLDYVATSVHSGRIYEPGYENGSTYLWLSPLISLDVTNYTTILFKGNAKGIVVLIPAKETATVSTGGGVTISLPTPKMVFNDTHGALLNGSKIGSTYYYPASAAKTITDPVPSVWNIPAGTTLNNGTGHVSTYFGALTRFDFNSDIAVTTLADAAHQLVVGNMLQFRVALIVCGVSFVNLELVVKDAIASTLECTPA